MLTIFSYWHPPLYENQDQRHHSQVIIPNNGHGLKNGAFVKFGIIMGPDQSLGNM